MHLNIIKEFLKGVPFINGTKDKILYEFILTNKLSNVLELGFAHGTASCYIAAALDEIGFGKLTSVDLASTECQFKPSIEDQLYKTQLGRYVDIYRMKSGYNWFLHNEIAKCSNNSFNRCLPKYDLIIIDGAKNWTIDSSSFFLADKLLKLDGWILWDDYSWTYECSNKKRTSTDGIVHNSLSQEELEVPHIKEIFELLVKQHSGYSNFQIDKSTDWAWAQKSKLI